MFFTATPADSLVQTVYARRPCTSGPACSVHGRETVAVSNPSLNVSDPTLNISGSGAQWECKKCEAGSEAQPAVFQGASADGLKVFFTTTQSLLGKDETVNLYEYDFEKSPGEQLVRISRAPETEPAGVEGVLRTSSDGSVVYFVASGVLEASPNKTINAEGEVVSQAPVQGKSNLYAYDTDTGEMKFVADIEVEQSDLGNNTESVDTNRYAQTTPDGAYLVFSSKGALAGDTNKRTAQGVYRYDFNTGELTWVSHAAPGCTVEGCGKQGKNALVAPLEGTAVGDEADVGDWNRAISDGGEYIIFATPEALQNHDVNEATDVYEWHCSSPCSNPATEGITSMISDGHGTVNPTAVMSSSGSDIFFITTASLVGQDTDTLSDVYDARVDGGFPAPAESSCSGEACQGTRSEPSSFGLTASSLLHAGGNLSSPAGGTLAFQTSKPKQLTRVQQLARALKACNEKRKKKARPACERAARKKYGATTKPKAKGKATAKKARGRATYCSPPG
jgi:hypothetical protein